MRLTSSSILEVLRQDDIRTAHANGVSASRVLRAHALKNAIIPVITLIGAELATVEQVAERLRTTEREYRSNHLISTHPRVGWHPAAVLGARAKQAA